MTIASSSIDSTVELVFRTVRQIGHGTAPPPFGHGLRVDPVPFGQSSQAVLTTLYRSTDLLCCGGAAVKNLAQSDRAPGRGVGAGILSSVGCSIRLPQSAE